MARDMADIAHTTTCTQVKSKIRYSGILESQSPEDSRTIRQVGDRKWQSAKLVNCNSKSHGLERNALSSVFPFRVSNHAEL